MIFVFFWLPSLAPKWTLLTALWVTLKKPLGLNILSSTAFQSKWQNSPTIVSIFSPQFPTGPLYELHGEESDLLCLSYSCFSSWFKYSRIYKITRWYSETILLPGLPSVILQNPNFCTKNKTMECNSICYKMFIFFDLVQ